MRASIRATLVLLLMGFQQLQAQEAATPVEKPVELKGDLKAFEMLRDASAKHLKAWSAGRGRFITMDRGKTYAVRAEWMNDSFRIEEISVADGASEDDIDWTAAPQVIWLQSPRVQVRFAPPQRIDVLLDCQDQIFGRQHLHVAPTLRFAHQAHGRPWSRLLDPMDPECAKNCVFTATRTDDLITVEAISTQFEGVTTTFSAKKADDWLISEWLFRSGRSRGRNKIDYARNEKGLIVPEKLLIEGGAAGETSDLETESFIHVLEVDFLFKPDASRFSLKGLPIPPKSRVSAMDQAGNLIYKNRLDGDNTGVTSVIDAYLSAANETRTKCE